MQRPKNRKVLKSKWVYKLKHSGMLSRTRWKARMVIKGYEQVGGLDYTDTFSSVVRYDSVRTFLTVAAQKKMKVQQFNVKTAFLNGELKETIYVEQPRATVMAQTEL